MTLLRTTITLLPFAMLACTMPPKNLGNESESNSGGASDDGGGACMDGDVKPDDDGCNTCTCIEGEWGCTLLGCSSDDGFPPVCEDGDMMPAPDGCNTCECLDGAWACTDVACPSDDGTPVCEDGDTMPAPDGCNTCTCEAGAWLCSEMDCNGNGWFGDEILICDPGAPTDGLQISAVAFMGDVLLVDVSYGGGCEEHDFGLCWDGAFAESDPVQIQAFISHDGHDDPCDALPSEQLAFDLVPLKQAWQDGYQTEHGSIEIHLAGWMDQILYSF